MHWVPVLGVIMLWLSPNGGALRTQQRGQGNKSYQISPKPCQVNNLRGTCMFVWECIKSEGEHLGMCVDSFMFGSCCAHNQASNAIPGSGPGGDLHVSAEGGGPAILYSPPGAGNHAASHSYTKPVHPNNRPHRPGSVTHNNTNNHQSSYGDAGGSGAPGGRPNYRPENATNKRPPNRPGSHAFNGGKPNGAEHRPHNSTLAYKPTTAGLYNTQNTARPNLIAATAMYVSSHHSHAHKPTLHGVSAEDHTFSIKPHTAPHGTFITSASSRPAPPATERPAYVPSSSTSAPAQSSLPPRGSASLRPIATDGSTDSWKHRPSSSIWQVTTEPGFITKPRPNKPTINHIDALKPKPNKKPPTTAIQWSNKPTTPSKPSTTKKPNHRPNISTTLNLVPNNKPQRPLTTLNLVPNKPSGTNSLPDHSSSSNALPDDQSGAPPDTNFLTGSQNRPLASHSRPGSLSFISGDHHQGSNSLPGGQNFNQNPSGQVSSTLSTTSVIIETVDNNTPSPTSDAMMPTSTISSVSASSGNRSARCGITPLFPRPEKRIVGGKNAPFGRWPWQVSVRRTSFFGFSSTHRCGGAVLNENWIATAGHCVDDLLTSQIRIRVGEYDFSKAQEEYPYVERMVAKKVVHPKYNFFTYEYDLALVRLDKPLEFAPHISPICLPASDDLLIGENATVTGWGRLSEGGTLPSVLQEVQVPIVSNDRCKSMFLRAGRHEFIPEIFLCAGHEGGGQDSCQGDSGGPLQVKGKDGRYFLAGIISWGIGCAEANLPGVCTRISKFVPWILENVT